MQNITSSISSNQSRLQAMKVVETSEEAVISEATSAVVEVTTS